MSATAQSGFIPAHDGQPSRRSAWLDDAVNMRWRNFYRNTVETLERAHVRPRHNRAKDESKREHRSILAGLQTLYASSLREQTPPRLSHA